MKTMRIALAIVLACGLAGCATLPFNNSKVAAVPADSADKPNVWAGAATGLGVGALGGAAIGGAIGAIAGSALGPPGMAAGAAAGAAVGGGTGAIIGAIGGAVKASQGQ